VIPSLLKIKQSQKNFRSINEDFVYFLAFLYSISTGGVGEVELIKTAIKTDHGRYSLTLKQAYNLGIGWSFGLSKSCRVISERLNDKSEEFLKHFLVKFSQTIALGENLPQFFSSEMKSSLLDYEISYERNMESQKLFLEMFYTIMSTSSFLLAAATILAMLMGSGSPEVLLLAIIASIISGLSMFLFMMYRMFPRDILSYGTKEELKFRIKIYISVLSGFGLGFTLFMLDVVDPILSVGVAFIPLIYPGLLAKKMETNILKVNAWYPGFIKYFGSIYSTLGSVSLTMESVLRTDFGPLHNNLASFSNRLKNRIDSFLAFDLLSTDAKSHLISKGNTILANSLEKGANMSEVGERVSEVSRVVNELRAKRFQNAKTFEFTILMLHVLSLAVFGLLSELVGLLDGMLGSSGTTSSALTISSVDPVFISVLMPVMIVTFSIINGFAIKIAQGGMYKTVIYNIGILGIIGSVVAYGVISLLGNALDSSLVETGQDIVNSI